MEASTPLKVDVDALLRHWIDDGLITVQQAEVLRADVPVGVPARAAPPAPRVASLVVEATGYLGGVLVMVALGLVVGRYWVELPTVARLALAGVVTAALLLAGVAVPDRQGGVGGRLRAVLWSGAAVGLGAFLGLVGGEVYDWREEAVASFATAGAAVLAAVLWYRHRHPVLHLAVLAAIVATVAAATTLLPDPAFLPGVAVWGAGLGWAMLAWGGVLAPRRLGVLLGAAVTTFAAMTVAAEGWGSVFAVATMIALVAVAVIMRDLVLLAVAALGALNVLPVVVTRFFPGVLSAALVLLVVGLLLVGAAVVTARRRRTGNATDTARRDWRSGPRAFALASAAVVAAVVAVVVVTLGQ